MQHWHLIMTKPREDERAAQHLLNQDYEFFRPLLKQFRIKKGKQIAVTEPLFPRYLFIRLDDALSDWSKIRSTRGVAQLVRFTELPAVVPDDLILEIKNQCVDDDTIDITLERPYVLEKGDEIEISEGSFKGIRAIIKQQIGEDRVLLLLKLLGKEQELEVSLNDVKTIS